MRQSGRSEHVANCLLRIEIVGHKLACNLVRALCRVGQRKAATVGDNAREKQLGNVIVNAFKLFCKIKNYLCACTCRRIDIAKPRKTSKRRMMVYGDCRFCSQKRFHTLTESVQIARIDTDGKLVNAFFGESDAIAHIHALVLVRHGRIAIANDIFALVFEQNVKRKHTAERIPVGICVRV